MIKRIVLLLLIFTLFITPMPKAYANAGLITRGVAKTVFSVFQIPMHMVSHSTRVIFPVGLLTGAVAGSMQTVVGTVSGVVDIARGAAPYAKYAVLFV